MHAIALYSTSMHGIAHGMIMIIMYTSDMQGLFGASLS